MSDRYLTDLADVIRRTGYPVTEVDGWQTRSRGGSGYDAGPGRPNHIMIHHTASGPSMDGWDDVNYCTFADDDAPLCNLYLGRTGEWWVCAAAATNCNGAGYDPCQIVADDSMNSAAIAIEAGNDGVGEAWSDVQVDSYLKGCRQLCQAYGIPVSCIHAHWEWAPTRKTDPAGGPHYQEPPRLGPNPLSWNMDQLRADVAAPLPPDPDQGDDMPLSDNDIKRIAQAVWDHNISGDQPDEAKPARWRLRQAQGAARHYLGPWKEQWELPDQTLLKKIDEQTSDR